MNKIIVITPGSLLPSTQQKMEKQGFIILEHTNPAELEAKLKNSTVEYVVENCIVCGDRIYLTEERRRALIKNKQSFCCPQGHSQSFN